MTTTTFDTLAYTKKMKAIGFTDQQAEGQAEALAAAIEEKVATKTDILLLQRDIKELEYKLTIRMGGMIGGAIAILGYLIKFGH